MIRAAAVLLSLLLAGCTTTSTVQQAHATRAGQAYAYTFVDSAGNDLAGTARLVRIIRDRLRDAGLLAGEAAPGPRIEVELTHYYVRSDVTRALAGMLAGRDRIASRVTVFDGAGKAVGRFEVETTNLSTWGSQDGLMGRHADGIVERLAPRR